MFNIKVYRQPKRRASWEAVCEGVRRFAFSPYLSYGLVGAFALADLVLFALLVLPLSRERDLHQAKVKALQTSLSREKRAEERLRSQIAFLSQRKGEGIPWAEKLEALPQILPASLWLEEVRLEKDPSRGKSSSGAPSGAGLPLVIRGFSSMDRGNNHIEIIGGFAKALNEELAFSRDFESIQLESMETSRGKEGATGFLLRSRPRPQKP